MQRWDAQPDWRRKLMPQYQRFRQTLTSVEKWRAERSGERPRDLAALVEAALTASYYTLDDACLRTLAAIATAPAPTVTAAPLPKPAI